MSQVEIIDFGDRRKVRIRGEAYSYNGYAPDGIEFETVSSVGLLRDLERVKGTAWLKDEIDRAECPDYLEIPLTRFIKRFLPETVGLKVLDIGSGAGASSIVLARLGMNVIGIERDRELHEIATRRVQEWGLSSQIHQECVANASNGLSFLPESFDAIVLSAVVEHVDPSDRLKLLGQAWSVLKTGGLLFIHDTPNRLWPYDGHTTGLWFTTWLPWKLRMAYARRFSRRFEPTISEDDLIAKGLHPPTYWEIKEVLSSAVCLNQEKSDDVSFAFGLTDHRQRSLPLAITRAGVISLLKIAGSLVTVLKAPPAAILQNLDLCFKKL
jgi:2-polyprenyl-3-methyl-5-hydroxy-6-metoxy-1,4-benzoquinol methylase